MANAKLSHSQEQFLLLRIKQRRPRQELLSARDVAVMAGVSPAHLYHCLRGIRRMSPAVAAKLGKVLRCSADEILDCLPDGV
jgi:plasmid maintenance system antidote protein VapI